MVDNTINVFIIKIHLITKGIEMHDLNTIKAQNDAAITWFTTSSQALNTVAIIGASYTTLGLDTGYRANRSDIGNGRELLTLVYAVPTSRVADFEKIVNKEWKARRDDEFNFKRRCRVITEDKAQEIIKSWE